MTFDIAPWFACMIVAAGLGPWIASSFAEPRPFDCIVLTIICTFAPTIVAEFGGRAARRFRNRAAERILIHFCYIAPVATAAALFAGRLPTFVAARFPDAPGCVQLASGLVPALVSIYLTIISEQRAFALAGQFEPPRAADRLRLAMLPLLVPFLVTGIYDICSLSQRFRNIYESYGIAQIAGMAVLALVLLYLFPRLVFIAIRTQPLQAGPLADAFDGVARAMRVRVREFRVALTGRSVSNAALLGGIGPRRVILTDRIIEEHPGDELVAVVGHELGHARGSHLWLFGAFLGSIAIWILNIPGEWLEPIGEWGVAASGLTLLFIILRFGLGPIARTCEHEADLFGAAVAGSFEPLARSLERIAGPRHRCVKSWRHPSVMARIEFLQKAAADPSVASRPRRILRTIHIISLILLIGGAVVSGFRLWRELPRERVVAALRASDFAKANAIIASHPGTDMAALVKLTNALARTGGAGDVSLRERAQAALLRGNLEDAAVFGRLAALRTGKQTDVLFATIVESLLEGETTFVEGALAGPASFLTRDSRLGPAIRQAVEEVATKPAIHTGK
ncbi:MAG: M48 family metalloprotease [Planctomycetes bacterium]|nr:M48 family metalloprotease [Planctomycetota bacterium]